MRTFLFCLLISLLSFGLAVNEAAAKRFGGGRSFGVQRSHSSLFKSNSTTNKSQWQQSSNKSKWGGVLGGMLIGGLLTSLFMGHGFMNGMMSWLIIGVVLFLLTSFLRRKMQPGFQSSQAQSFSQNTFKPLATQTTGGSAFNEYPAGFSADDFLRQAKVTFNRLQMAYDQKNLQDIQEFTTPEVFGEIKMQLDEMGNQPNTTEVLQLNAQLLDVSQQVSTQIASVRFTGLVKENNESAIQLDEIWHFRQFNKNEPWLIGGIQNDFDASFTQ
ncbi:MAG: Tim44 domain-containing protein [Legionella sp.]|nr:MAG: Tim44 domain-containing protein [Legionella sp.]